MLVVGVDGCPGGWIAVRWETDSGELTPRFHPTFAEIVNGYPEDAAIGVDIPIGLRDDELPRDCDIAARKLLGRPRGSSVFPAPRRRLLACATHAEASGLSRACFGKGVSVQAFGIYCKIAEVDEVMTPERQRRVVEVHPEVSFWALAGGMPAANAKKTLAGFEERRGLLMQHGFHDVPATRADARRLASYAGPDDLLDAIAAAWSANRCARGDAKRLPDEPERDERGLRMEIVW